MAGAIDVPLETASDVETLGVACRGQGLGRRPGARAAAADEIERRVLVAAGQLLDLGDEIRIDLHLRIDLPADEPGLLAEAAQVRDSDIVPFRLRAHIDQNGFGILGEPLPRLVRRYVTRIAHAVTRCAYSARNRLSARSARDSTNG